MTCNALILQIVSGIPKTPDDPQSAEQGLAVLPLLIGQNDNGLAVSSWQPTIAGSKPNSIWADSAIAPGRTLIAAEDANAVETITLVCSAPTHSLLAARLKTLYRFRELAQEFWESEWQIEPVYLKWQALDAPGPQYALIYVMDIAVTYPDIDQSLPIADVIITIEREPYWRAIPPGANPILWTFEINDQVPTEATLDLMNNSNHIVTQTIKNTREWNTTQTAVVSQNYVDVPAASIPGDAPALACITTQDVSSSPDGAAVLLIGRSTKPGSLPLQAGGNIDSVYTLNAGDSSLMIADTTKVADATSAPASNSSATGVRTTTTFATSALMVARIRWDDNSLTKFNYTNGRGTFAVFIRCRLSAAAVVNMRWELGILTFGPSNQLSAIVASPLWSVVYLGQVTIPPENRRAKVSGKGNGLDTRLDNSFGIQAERISGAGSLQIADVFLLPVDECSQAIDNAAQFANNTVLVDNTGYLTHGIPESFATVLAPASGASPGTTITALSGQDITLIPNMNNRLFFYLYSVVSQQSYLLASGRSMAVRIDIIPRWRGIRDI